MKTLKVLIPLSILSLVYNVAILFSVTLNLHWVRTRAAGGQYKDFPIGIRIVYLIIAVIMIFLIGMITTVRIGIGYNYGAWTPMYTYSQYTTVTEPIEARSSHYLSLRWDFRKNMALNEIHNLALAVGQLGHTAQISSMSENPSTESCSPTHYRSMTR